ncbi:hypothetical protein JBL43_00760 [Aureibaculum sp. A20]|uniref:Lipoprotein n=1 Tax=Aureibaculum flavum TaxID=2795986 RepID=A0ABS0WLA2_9FLAO|nr:hypothetical protein [Aureibaculum flavum]MBJ2172746.1 hypothetical protein [Aureibaculum flavum]
MKITTIFILMTSLFLACGNATKEKKELVEGTTAELSSEPKIESQNDRGITKAYEIINYLKTKDYKKVRASFFNPVAKKVPEELLKKYVDKASELIAEFGIPEKEKVLSQVSSGQINEPEITKERNIEFLIYAFPMPPARKNEPPLRMITISFLPSFGFDKMIMLNVLDNSNVKEVKPDFEKLDKFDFKQSDFKRIKIYHTGGSQKSGKDGELSEKISDLKKTVQESLNITIELMSKSKIEKTEIANDITRYKGNPETISLHLIPYEKLMVMPNEIDRPYFMITQILENENGIVEKEKDYIIVRQFKQLNSSYLYYLKKSENMELYNQLKSMENYAR